MSFVGFNPSSDFSSEFGETSLGTKLDTEFENIATAFRNLNAALMAIQRADSALLNESVKVETLHPDTLKVLMTDASVFRGNWTQGELYQVSNFASINGELYLCAQQHYANNATSDIAGGYWLKLSNNVTNRAVVVVTSIPASPAAVQDAVIIYHALEGKVYRWNGSAFVKSVGAGDIEPLAVVASNIHSIDLPACASRQGGSLAAPSLVMQSGATQTFGQTGFRSGDGVFIGNKGGGIIALSAKRGANEIAIDENGVVLSGKVTIGSAAPTDLISSLTFANGAPGWAISGDHNGTPVSPTIGTSSVTLNAASTMALYETLTLTATKSNVGPIASSFLRLEFDYTVGDLTAGSSFLPYVEARFDYKDAVGTLIQTDYVYQYQHLTELTIGGSYVVGVDVVAPAGAYTLDATFMLVLQRVQ